MNHNLKDRFAFLHFCFVYLVCKAKNVDISWTSTAYNRYHLLTSRYFHTPQQKSTMKTSKVLLQNHVRFHGGVENVDFQGSQLAPWIVISHTWSDATPQGMQG